MRTDIANADPRVDRKLPDPDLEVLARIREMWVKVDQLEKDVRAMKLELEELEKEVLSGVVNPVGIRTQTEKSPPLLALREPHRFTVKQL